VGRRLSNTRVDATIVTPDITELTAIENKAADKAQVATEISSATSTTITATDLTASTPVRGVEVTTSVAPMAGQASTAFDTAAIASVQQRVSSDLGVAVQVTAATTGQGTTTPQASTCTWEKVGSGYCASEGLSGEIPLRLASWVLGSLQQAKDACCASQICGGFHLDKSASDYVLLDKVGTPDGTDQGRRECWVKVSPANTDLSSAESAYTSSTLVLAILMAAAVAA